MGKVLGRPTLYNDDMQALADRYLESFESLGHVVPSRAGLCLYLKVAKSTTQEWEQKYPNFSATLSNIAAMQEHLTLNNGLSGSFNSTIAKLVLANHGYSDKQDVNMSSEDGTMSPTGKSLDDFYKDSK